MFIHVLLLLLDCFCFFIYLLSAGSKGEVKNRGQSPRFSASPGVTLMNWKSIRAINESAIVKFNDSGPKGARVF